MYKNYFNMLNYFCSNCGGKNIYQFQKPKFCSFCGNSFSQIGSLNNIKSNNFDVTIANNKPVENLRQDFDDDHEDVTESYSSMRGLDVKIEKYNNNSGVKLGDLVSDDPKPRGGFDEKKSIKQRRGRKKISKSLPESFVSEAKMSGRNYVNDIEPNITDIEN